jgi:hypothetical protein
MKSNYVMPLLFLCISCSSAKYAIRKEESKGSIVYVLPKTVSRQLSRQLVPGDTTYFILGTDTNTYSIFTGNTSSRSAIYSWIKTTNRKVFLNGRFYPLLLSSDEAFAIKETPNEIASLSKTNKYYLYTRPLIIGELSYVKFDYRGNIVKTGQ